MEKYFPSPGLFRRLPLIRAFRWPLMAVFSLLLVATGAAFRATGALNLRALSFRLFESFANHSYRRGMLKGLS